MNAALDSLLSGLNAALRDHVRADTGLFDPVDQQPSPPDHYGHVCAALALACADADDWDSGGRHALQAWLDLADGQLGHLPFNRLALLLLRSVLTVRGLARSDAALIEAGLRRCTLRRSYPSNNWSLLAQTCRLLEAPAARKAAESRRLCHMLERWTTPKGCFIDFPATPGARFCTPLAYHHKALFLTALACWFHEDAELGRHARRLLDWLVHCWDPAGYAGGYGRSSHALFGDACLLAGLILMGIADQAPQQPIAALAQRLARQRRADGFLWLNPAGACSGTASWDAYMHLSVYNAWAAAIIGAARQLRRGGAVPEPLRGATWRAARAGLFHDEAAGLACLRSEGGLNALVATHGQPPQAYGREEAEFRYAGGTLVHLRTGDGAPLAAPAVRTSHRALLEHPALAGWTPVLLADGTTYVLDEFDACALAPTANGLQVTLSGQPRALFRAPPRGLGNRLLAAADWRFLGGTLGRNAALQRARLATVTGCVRIELAADGDGTIRLSHQLEIRSQARIEHLNPLGTIAPGDAASHREFPASIPGAAPDARAPCTVEPGEAYTASVCARFTATSAHDAPP